MAVRTLSEAIDNMFTTTWQDMKAEAIDNIFDGSPFWFWMRDGGHIRTQPGGKYITESLRYAKSDKVLFIGKGGTVTLGDKEFLTQAAYDWKYLTDTIVRFGVDEQKNRGKHVIMNYTKEKLNMSNDSLADQMELSLFGAAGSALEFNGLQDLVADAPATGTIGGIDPATYTWWRNNFKTMTGSSFATNGIDNMRTMLHDCSKGLQRSKPNIIVSGQLPYEYYEDSVVDQKRIVNSTMGDAGFENIEYKGIPMIWSPVSDVAERMYFLNTNYLTFVYDPMMFFDMTEWKAIPDQVNDKAAQIVTAGELTTSRRKAHGVIFLINTA